MPREATNILALVVLHDRARQTSYPLTTNREQPKSIFHLLRLKNEKKAAKPVFNALSNGTI